MEKQRDQDSTGEETKNVLLALSSNILLTQDTLNQDDLLQLKSNSDIALLLLREIFKYDEKNSPFDSIGKDNSAEENYQSSNKKIEKGKVFDRDLRVSTESTPQNKRQIYQRKKRKSKYSDLYECGDLSFIRRESGKRYKKVDSKATTRTGNLSYAQKNDIGSSWYSLMDEEDDDGDDLLLVRHLMHIIRHPKTKHHQDFAVLVLQSDQKLLQKFLTEKDKESYETIPVLNKFNVSNQIATGCNQGRSSILYFDDMMEGIKDTDVGQLSTSSDTAFGIPDLTAHLLKPTLKTEYENNNATPTQSQYNTTMLDNTFCQGREASTSEEVVYQENMQYILQKAMYGDTQSSLQRDSGMSFCATTDFLP